MLATIQATTATPGYCLARPLRLFYSDVRSTAS